MAIKAGQFLHDANGFVVDRIQSGGVGNLNIPEEKIYELGNYQTVATVRDIPDLSFDLESFDVSTEVEALLNFVDPTSTNDGDEFDFADHVPMDVISPFKSATGAFDIVRGIIVPYLTLESATYRFGVRQNSTQQFSLRGDAVYYAPGSPYYEEFSGDGATSVFNFANTAIVYQEQGSNIYALSVCVVFADGTYKRLFHGEEYTDSATGITITDPATDTPAGSTIKVCYASTTAATYAQTVHQTSSVKPAAVRGKDIDVYVADPAATTSFSRWTGVQSFEVTRSVNLENDEEFGNTHFVSSDYDTAEVSGSITIKDRDVDDLFAKIHAVTGVATDEVVGPHVTALVPLEVRVSDPDTGDRLKTLYIPDARFTVPSVQGRVQTKQEVTFDFDSDGGSLLVYQGERS